MVGVGSGVLIVLERCIILRGYDHDSVFQRHQNGYLSFLCIVWRRWPALYHTLERSSCKTDTELERLTKFNPFRRHSPTNTSKLDLLAVQPFLTLEAENALSRYDALVLQFVRFAFVIDNELTPQTTEVVPIHPHIQAISLTSRRA